MAENTYSWVNFYTELADKLVVYIMDRPGLIEKIKQIYDTIGIRLPKLETENQPTDIDPFTVFGLFNKGITDANRKLILKGFKEEFGISAPVPASFAGVPVLNNMKATFYYFKPDRGEEDIENLWQLFNIAVNWKRISEDEKERQMFIDSYNTVIHQKGVSWNITMGLYWICPNVFLSLDSRNRWFMMDPKNRPADFVATVKPLLSDTVPSGGTI